MRSSIEWFVIFIFVAKLFYLGLLIYTNYLEKNKKNPKTVAKYRRYETIIEVIVLLSLGILLVVLFNPRNIGAVRIDGELKTTLFLLGIVLIISVKGFWRDLVDIASIEKETD